MPYEQKNSTTHVGKGALYDAPFYKERHQKTLYSASRILAAFFHIVPGKHASAIDFGCGVGTWLSVCAKRGLSVCGIDGPWVPQRYLQIPPEHFHSFDLETCLLDRTSPLWSISPADVLLSLEVAEHFPANVADAFAAFVCTHCEYALFSAAIPHQGGERARQRTMAIILGGKIQKHDFIMLDVLRVRIWDDEKIPCWYRQNCFLLAKRTHLEKLTTVSQEAIVTDTRHDIVYPEQYVKMLELFAGQQL